MLNFRAYLRYYWQRDSAPFSETVFCLIFAIIYLFLFPPIELFKNLDFKGVSIIYLYNITIMLVVAGGLHLFFYTFKKQENILKYDSRKVSNNKIFTFNKQIFDNIFWSLVSGVTIWTFYETFLFWGYANEFITKINFSIDAFSL